MGTSALRPSGGHWLALTCALALCCTGCQVIRHDYHGERQLTPGTKLLTAGQELGPVEGSKKAMFVFFGLIPINDGSGALLIEERALEEFGDGVIGVTNVRIDESNSAGDVLLNVVLGVFFSTRSVHVTGIAHGAKRS